MYYLICASICPRHPKAWEIITRLSSSLNSMGVSPPRLLYGPAANYGSIIIPCACHRHHRELPGFYRIDSIARRFKRVVARLRSRLDLSIGTSNVRDNLNIQLSMSNIFGCFSQPVLICPLTYLNGVFPSFRHNPGIMIRELLFCPLTYMH